MANAKAFADGHREDLRYCHPEKRWYVWDKSRWRADDTGEVERRAKETARLIAVEAAGVSQRCAVAGDRDGAKKALTCALAVQQLKAIRAMLELARSDERLVVLPEHFDRNAWVLNCPNGTIDLLTGKLRPHDRGDMLTALCPIAYNSDAKCPAWERFLSQVFAHDAELVEFVQRYLGYCLTGDTSIDSLTVLWGAGRNGKSTLVDTVLAVMGADYSGMAAPELLLSKRDGSHPTEKADLKGKRFVCASETAEGRKLDEATMKLLTGGDRVRARRMREDFWEFDATHKISLVTNYRPRIAEGWDGTWGRLTLVPFAVKFWDADRGEAGAPELKAVPLMGDALKRELPGVLAWMVRGCQKWLAAGRTLTNPRAVAGATRAYQASEDVIGRFLSEQCVRGPGCEVRSAALYSAFKSWWEGEGEYDRPYSKKEFGERLEAVGIGKRRSNGIIYTGVRIGHDDTHGTAIEGAQPLDEPDADPIAEYYEDARADVVSSGVGLLGALGR